MRGMFDRMPDDEGMESLELIARILDEKPKLRVTFLYAMDREAFIDSLSYITSVKAFREKEDSLALRDLDPLPDSLLEVFLREE
jgi:hypothetical protein